MLFQCLHYSQTYLVVQPCNNSSEAIKGANQRIPSSRKAYWHWRAGGQIDGKTVFSILLHRLSDLMKNFPTFMKHQMITSIIRFNS